MWVRNVLDRLLGRSGVDAPETPQIVTVVGAFTRELLHALVAEPIDALVLVDHAPFADGSPPPDLPPDLPPAEIVRDQAQRAILALELARRAARTLTLAGSAPETWSASLAALLGWPVPGDVPGPPPGGEGAGLADVPLLATYLAPLFAAPGHPEPLALAWPRECFLDGDAPGTILPATAEVAGRARILAYGPYLPLPAGSWRARAFLGFSPDIGKMSFILEADSGSTVRRGFFEADRGGIFTLDLDFSVADALHPVELRLISQDSALEGQVALIEVALKELRA